jgi:hypothetical protein
MHGEPPSRRPRGLPERDLLGEVFGVEGTGDEDSGGLGVVLAFNCMFSIV